MRGLAALACAFVRAFPPSSSHHPHRIIQPTFRHMSSPSAPFLDAITERRTIYAISSESTIPDSKIVEIVQHAVKHAPSAFNSQNTRAAVLLGAQHTKLWDAVLATFPKRAGLSEAQVTALSAKAAAFKAGYGTVLYFEDQATIKVMQERAPPFKDYFPQWSGHTDGMVQFIVWTALEKEGLGASLQHFNPSIDEFVQGEWGIPTTWQLVAQMPFGKPVAQPGEKTYTSIEERVKVFGANL